MSRIRGQALVELALCLPVVLLIGLGAAAVVRVVDAAEGLRAATEAAAGAAARAPNPAEAEMAAQARFAAVIADYPVASPTLHLSDDFVRGSSITASATGQVDVRWESVPMLPAWLYIAAQTSMEVEPWRARR